MPDHQPGAEFLLEFLNLVGNVGLADIQLTRRAAEVAGASDVMEAT